MARFDSDMRQLERRVAKLTGYRAQAAKLRKNIEKQVAQAAAKSEAQVIAELVRRGKAGWVNDPGKNDAILVAARNKRVCAVVDAKGKLIRGNKVKYRKTPNVDKARFIQHLKSAGIEDYVSHMYLDDKNNVTVGIGHLIRRAADAFNFPFIDRRTNRPASPSQIQADFDAVKKSGFTNTKAPAFRPLTSLDLSEADATVLAFDDLDDFIDQLDEGIAFPEFHTFPPVVKLGLLDLVYNTGVQSVLDNFKVFVPAVRLRNWKLAAKESHRGEATDSRNDIVQQWFLQHARAEPFYFNVTCKHKINALTQ